MQQFCQYGSVRGATGNRRLYRDKFLYPEIPMLFLIQENVIAAQAEDRMLIKNV